MLLYPGNVQTRISTSSGLMYLSPCDALESSSDATVSENKEPVPNGQPKHKGREGSQKSY